MGCIESLHPHGAVPVREGVRLGLKRCAFKPGSFLAPCDHICEMGVVVRLTGGGALSAPAVHRSLALGGQRAGVRC